MRTTVIFSGTLALASVGYIPSSDACGGFFCQAQPVIQTGEQIVFSVDRSAATVDAIINIQYSGPAENFAWILPLQSKPEQIGVGPQSLFQVVNRLTTPQFQLRFESENSCVQAVSDPADEDGDGDGDSGDGVQVLARAEVGPFDTVVLEGSDREEILTWLTDNDYLVTDEMMALVEPYVLKGDVLLALKLLKDSEVGDIQPIHVKMIGEEVCVPIRLTAIAASDDMDITVTVLSDEGRAIPKNFFEIELNQARIDWFSGGANYRSLVAEAANEAEGNAFTTEFAGSARLFDDQIFPGYPSRESFEGLTDFTRFVEALAEAGLITKPGLGPIIRRHVAEPLGPILNEQADAFDGCIGCYIGREGTIDAAGATAEIWERIVEPEEIMQELFDQRAYATRLYTLLSPDEMTVDPEFSFRSDLPDVSNIHWATLIQQCSRDGRLARERLAIEDTDQEVDLEQWRDAQIEMPATSRIRQLAEDVDVADNREAINAALQVPGSDGSNCSSTGPAGGLPWWGALLGGMYLLTRRRRRPSAA